MIRRLRSHNRRHSRPLLYHSVPFGTVACSYREEAHHRALPQSAPPGLACVPFSLCNERGGAHAVGTNLSENLTAKLAGLARAGNNTGRPLAVSAIAELEAQLNIKSLVNMHAYVKYYAESINHGCITSQTKSLG